jgi:hypothetical protein
MLEQAVPYGPSCIVASMGLTFSVVAFVAFKWMRQRSGPVLITRWQRRTAG